MLEAEASSSSSIDHMSDRLHDLGIANKLSTMKEPLLPQNIENPNRSSRPLIVDDELDIELELDENIDTTVS